MSAEENKAAQRRIIEEVINRKDLDLADELFSEEHELHPEAAGVARGPEGMKRAFAGLHEEFPDIRVEIEEMVAEGEVVAVRLTFSGTHAPSGERTAWPEMVFARCSGGKAVESWEVTDTGRDWDSPPGSSGLLLVLIHPSAWKGKFSEAGARGSRTCQRRANPPLALPSSRPLGKARPRLARRAH